jgi:hypothetical protein
VETTISQALMAKERQAEGVRTRQQILLAQLHGRFGDVPEGIIAAVESCRSVKHLHDWLLSFATAATLDEVGIDDFGEKDASAVEKAIAKTLLAKARKAEAMRTRRQVLLRLLRSRCPELPADIVTAIESCKRVKQLDVWLERLAHAECLEEIGTRSKKASRSGDFMLGW